MLAAAGTGQYRSAREMDGYHWEHLLEHIVRSESWDEADFLLSDEHFLAKCSGSIRKLLPQILSSWPQGRPAENLTSVPDRYVRMCRSKQAREFVPDGLIPSNALGTIMRRPDGKLRDTDKFVDSVESILTMFSRAIELATAMADDPRFGQAHLSRMMTESRGLRRMADAVWDCELEERSGALANLSNFVKRDWDKGLRILATAGVSLDDKAS